MAENSPAARRTKVMPSMPNSVTKAKVLRRAMALCVWLWSLARMKTLDIPCQDKIRTRRTK